MTTAIYLAHLNPVTNSHVEIIEELKKDNKVVEYQDSLHEHFIYPCKINKGNYMPPQDLGYSIEMKENSVNEFSYPNGEYWKKN